MRSLSQGRQGARASWHAPLLGVEAAPTAVKPATPMRMVDRISARMSMSAAASSSARALRAARSGSATTAGRRGCRVSVGARGSAAAGARTRGEHRAAGLAGGLHLRRHRLAAAARGRSGAGQQPARWRRGGCQGARQGSDASQPTLRARDPLGVAGKAPLRARRPGTPAQRGSAGCVCYYARSAGAARRGTAGRRRFCELTG